MEQGYGKIINISSGSAEVSHPVVSVSTMVKGGTNIFTRNLAGMVIGSGNNGEVRIPWLVANQFHQRRQRSSKGTFPAGNPIGRGTEPRDIANAVAFLSSDVSANIVGQLICVDGGSTMQQVGDCLATQQEDFLFPRPPARPK